MPGEEEGNHTKTENSGKENNALPDPQPVVDGNHTEETENGAKHREERRKKRRWFPKDIKTVEWIMIVFTAVTAMAAWAGVWVAQGQLGEMRSSSKQTDDLIGANQNLSIAARSQAKSLDKLASILRGQLDQMQADQRPWISIDVSLDQPLVFLNLGKHKALLAYFKFTLENYGKSPAINIQTYATLSQDFGMKNVNIVDDAQKTYCANARMESLRDKIGGIAVFPGGTQSIRQGLPYPSVDKPIVYLINGCVDYTYGNGFHGETGFRIILGKQIDYIWYGIPFGDIRPFIRSDIFLPGGNLPPPGTAFIPVNDVDLGVDPTGGNYAQ